ncbi:MAG TPA: DUF1684 domain-containing protein [Thermoanaerobaculia bacterium]|nr:DUF1684 domain-containing protein [Thermoanaerobaculia bacterium]
MKRLALVLILAAACRHEPSLDRAAYEQDVMQWRKYRAVGLTKPDGWTTLVGLDWLNDGRNELKLPGGPAGTIVLQNGKTTLEPVASSGLTINGQPVNAPVEVKTDFDPNGPTIVKRGSVQFQIIKRDPRGYAVRIKDANGDARVHFKGLDDFPVDPQWRLVAKFEPYNPPKKIPITNVLGMTTEETSPGALVFTSPGDSKEYRIDPINEQGEQDLFIIIKDQTSRDSTYQAARYLYAKRPGPDGTTIVDFNKAYNPPCAFTPFATCPLPPPQNVLPFRIEAGEKRYAGSHR